MFITLSWVVLLCAILVLFMSHWVKAIKKITSPFAVKLFVPLIIFSWFVISNELWIEWGLIWAHWGCNQSLKWLMMHVRQFAGQMLVIKTLFVTMIALIPTVIAKLIEKPFRPFSPPYWASIYLWLIMMVFVVLPY